MSTIVFDTHAVFKRLVSSGMTESSAEAVASELHVLVQQRETAELEHKLAQLDQDTEALREEIRMENAQEGRKFEAYQSAIRADLENLELRLTSKFGNFEVRQKSELANHEIRQKSELTNHEIRQKSEVETLELRLKHDLTVRMGAMMAAAIAIVTALIKLIH